jgi:hypothetical protein
MTLLKEETDQTLLDDLIHDSSSLANIACWMTNAELLDPVAISHQEHG